jgi:hypothetical protein
MKWMKLTGNHGRDFLINMDRVSAIYVENDNLLTCVVTDADHYYVGETPEEIAACGGWEVRKHDL